MPVEARTLITSSTAFRRFLWFAFRVRDILQGDFLRVFGVQWVLHYEHPIEPSVASPAHHSRPPPHTGEALNAPNMLLLLLLQSCAAQKNVVKLESSRPISRSTRLSKHLFRRRGCLSSLFPPHQTADPHSRVTSLSL
jgi:hypothetical protein